MDRVVRECKFSLTDLALGRDAKADADILLKYYPILRNAIEVYDELQLNSLFLILCQL
jgi:hypothetical protein